MIGEVKPPKVLKELYPLYPVVRREEIGREITFKTLVRKKYDGAYYLIPFRVTESTEAKAIHSLHAYVYRYFMLGVKTLLEVKDDDQINEVTRLKKL